MYGGLGGKEGSSSNACKILPSWEPTRCRSSRSAACRRSRLSPSPSRCSRGRGRVVVDVVRRAPDPIAFFVEDFEAGDLEARGGDFELKVDALAGALQRAHGLDAPTEANCASIRRGLK